MIYFVVFIWIEWIELNTHFHCTVLPLHVIARPTKFVPFRYIMQMTDTQNVQNIYTHRL
jgi:hypothetical protein